MTNNVIVLKRMSDLGSLRLCYCRRSDRSSDTLEINNIKNILPSSLHLELITLAALDDGIRTSDYILLKCCLKVF